MFSVKRISLLQFLVQQGNKLVRLKLDPRDMDMFSIMEKITRARVKDCFADEETVYFVVARGEMGKALGKGGVNVKKVQERIKKKIKVIEFNDHLPTFVKNIIHPVKVEEILTDEKSIKIKSPNKKTKSLLIGRGGKNLKLLNRAIQRFYDKEVIIE